MGKVKEYYHDEIKKSNERLKKMEEYRYWSEIENQSKSDTFISDYLNHFKTPNPNTNESN